MSANLPRRCAAEVDRFGGGQSRVGEPVAVEYDAARPQINHLEDPSAKQRYASILCLGIAIVLISPLAYWLSTRTV